MTTRTEITPIITYPRDAIVTTAHLAAAFGVSEAIVEKMDLPCFYAGRKPRYLWGQVLDVLAEKASPTAGESSPQRAARRVVIASRRRGGPVG